MHGLMMNWPLLTTSLIKHAAEYHGDSEIVSRTVEGPIHRYTYSDAYQRIGKLANALRRLGVGEGDRVATLAWNGFRHFELYYAISGIGAICHTINPRLFEDQIEYIINHAADRFIFVDLTFIGILESLQLRLQSVERYVILAEDDHMPDTTLKEAVSYAALIDNEPEDYNWPVLDENLASALCYTSGTTGHPKGALYSHRSTLLHSFSTCTADHPLALSNRETVLPVVPMFHVHAWGIPYGAPMCGAKLVFPGPQMDGKSLYELLEAERVTLTAGVPTVWLGLLEYLRESGHRLNYLQCVNIGGAAPPLSMIQAFEEDYGVLAVHAWGMTEMSPVGTTGRLKGKFNDLTTSERYRIKRKQGRVIFGVEMKIVDDDGQAQPHDGATVGQLLVRGPWIASAYFEDHEASRAGFDPDGWFRTGDIANIDSDGHVEITDRAKDLIKSGGEWISSIDLENTAMAHPAVAEAAAIAMAHPKWGERPLLVIVRKPDNTVTADEILAFLTHKVAKWWVPDEVVFVDELPHTATGKVSKRRLRETFAQRTAES